MKVLMIIDGKRTELPVQAFEISYNKYEDFDIVMIMDTPAAIQNKIVEAMDVRKPSGRGIQAWNPDVSESGLISDFFDVNNNPLTEARAFANINVISKEAKIEEDQFVDKGVMIFSDRFPYKLDINDIFNSLPNACIQLVEREKVALNGHDLYIIEEPILKYEAATETYKIIEKISVVKKRSAVEVTEQSKEQPAVL